MKLSSVYIKKCFFGIFIAIVICFFFKMLMGKDYNSMEVFFLITYGGAVSYNSVNILYFLILSLPFLLQLYLFTDVMSSELDIATVYIFTRIGSKNMWFNRKCVYLLTYSAVYYLLQITTVIVFGVICGFTFENIKNFILLIMIALLLWVITGYMYILLANMLALKLKTYLAFFIAWFFYSPMQIITGNINNNTITKLMPSSQGLIAWHSSTIVSSVLKSYNAMNITEFSILFSVIYCTLLSTIIYIIGKFVLKRAEFYCIKEV